MKFIRFLLIAVLLLCAGTGAFFYWVWQDVATAQEHTSKEAIEIPRGATLESTLSILSSHGIVKHSLAVRLYAKLTGVGKEIKAGDYVFNSPITPVQVLQQLAEGGQGADKITVVEGWNRWDIAAAMCQIPILKLKNTDQALKLMDNKSLITDLDAKARDLEGYLYPETYYVYLTSTPQEMIEGMVSQFKKVWKAQLAESARNAHRSVHEIVTAASIIETEAKLKEERPIIASVIYNRLSKNMTLSMDSTIVYASKLAGKWKNDGKVYQSDIDRDSLFNTRKYHGLPPGPVGSPSLSSLQAAISPAKTDYIYYVRNPARNDGAHNFYTNAQDFEVGVQALRDWEKQQARKTR